MRLRHDHDGTNGETRCRMELPGSSSRQPSAPPVEIAGAGPNAPSAGPVSDIRFPDVKPRHHLKSRGARHVGQAGTPLADLEAALACRGADVSVRARRTGPVLGAEAGRGTSSRLRNQPFRVAAGRDGCPHHLRGSRNQRARRSLHSAGRVLKNVTGTMLRGGTQELGNAGGDDEVTSRSNPTGSTATSLSSIDVELPRRRWSAMARLSR